MKSIYEELSEERKELQAKGELPEWFTTMAWQMFKEKYIVEGKTLHDTYMRIASCAASHTPEPVIWEKKFFDIMWNGWFACSTPVLANMGTNRGCPVSCSGNFVQDSVYDFYESQKEAAILSQNGFGTSSYLGDIRPRGSKISKGGKASGVLPVLRDFVQVSRDISQGGTRRGAWAGYIDVEHDDFWEVANYVQNNPDDCNVGWNLSDKFEKRLDEGDPDAHARWQRVLKLKALTGKGYLYFVDKVARQQPPMYEHFGLSSKASNLCTEITLHSDEDHTYTCVLSSMNLAKWEEWKDTDAVFVATVFLDCVAEEFIKMGKTIRGLEKAVRFTERSRALGLGTLGFHTLLQEKMIAFEDFDAHMLNNMIFRHMDTQSMEASKWMAEHWGEPEWCRGYGVRNTHRLAIAPNTSSALICGSVSQGIEPIYKNAYIQGSAAGEITRYNPTLVRIMKERGVFSDETIDDIINRGGSVQHVTWLDDHEKMVFKTAFEIDQLAIIRLASARQKYIDQAQSINLFFAADEEEEYIAHVHQEAYKDPYIKSLYYMRSEAGVLASKGECVACEG